MERSDAELIEAARGGDGEAFNELVRRHHRRVFALVLRLVGNRQTAADLTQEAFLRAFEELESFRGEASFYTWLYRIAVNRCLREMEREKRLTFEAWPAVVESETDAVPFDPSNPEKLVLREEVKIGCLMGLVRCLPAEQRTAFVLSSLLDLPDRDVAEILCCTTGAVKARLTRARQSLAAFLERRCQWIDERNRCRCHRYIQHSLDRGLIVANPEERIAHADVSPLIRELDLLRQVVRLYGSLAAPVPPKTLVERIGEGMARAEWRVLR